MSKIGKQPILIPAGVAVEISGQTIKLTGPKGTLERKIARGIKAEVNDKEILVLRSGNNKQMMSLHGTMRSLIHNDAEGVAKGWSKKLELVGTGFRADTTGSSLNLIVGYSHPVKIEAPKGITFKVEKNIVTVDGIDRELVGQIAADIRSVRPPEPYKGKGIKYIDEFIKRKAGKAAAKTTGAA